jgi:hypothetical protein
VAANRGTGGGPRYFAIAWREITPFTLIFGEKNDRSEVWLRVDESGAIATSAKGGAP